MEENVTPKVTHADITGTIATLSAMQPQPQPDIVKNILKIAPWIVSTIFLVGGLYFNFNALTGQVQEHGSRLKHVEEQAMETQADQKLFNQKLDMVSTSQVETREQIKIMVEKMDKLVQEMTVIRERVLPRRN